MLVWGRFVNENNETRKMTVPIRNNWKCMLSGVMSGTLLFELLTFFVIVVARIDLVNAQERDGSCIGAAEIGEEHLTAHAAKATALPSGARSCVASHPPRQ